LPPPEESRLLTTVDDGVAGLRFIDAVFESSARLQGTEVRNG
jgi:hypothetical protein